MALLSASCRELMSALLYLGSMSGPSCEQCAAGLAHMFASMAEQKVNAKASST